ncbi:hypothetical protein Pmar_PMAR015572 [Perkinsus marinus ATCC 50983]|uniref:Uncharacterized protein n=1 Tax=Perkinsus marinus (strain ATCC 50983 / TXsc) TaxID=423536 RepID=C5KUH8_PERM5|nr:hypothetical protein Pmar_PMAR015572 [Perkinsus marinus ATCC 50983]EER11865.1 hypothetical protein Pmar_PMAR015572 [Perkinsus marinus ATCC 50983]|eukprot:XP_002780070.1 hypothetical protein Pmar_PMAR015572 [Perkinsus marinus ATCC 50983]
MEEMQADECASTSGDTVERATGSGSSSSGSAFSCMVRLAPCDLVSSQSGKGYYGKEEVDDLIDLMECEMESLECDVEYWKTLFNQSQDELNYNRTLIENLEQDLHRIRGDTSGLGALQSDQQEQQQNSQSSSLGRSSFASSCSSNSVLSQTLDASSRTVFSQSAASSRPVSLRSSPSTSSDKRRQRAARRKGIRVIRLGRRKSAVRETAQGGTSQGLYNGVTSSLGSLWKRMTGHSSSEKPKERAKILEGLTEEQKDESEAEGTPTTRAPEYRDVPVLGEGRILPTSPSSPRSVDESPAVQTVSPVHDGVSGTARPEPSAASDRRGSPSRPAEVGFTFEEYEREAEKTLGAIFDTTEKIINGDELSFGECLDEVLLPVAKELRAL